MGTIVLAARPAILPVTLLFLGAARAAAGTLVTARLLRVVGWKMTVAQCQVLTRVLILVVVVVD